MYYRLICVGAIGLLCVTESFSATAPETLAGTMYYDTAGIAPLGIGGTRRIVLERNGTYSFLFWYPVQRPAGVGPDGSALFQPPPDGNYKYIKTGAFNGVLELASADGTSHATITLSFSTDDRGIAFYSTSSTFSASSGSFQLFPLSGRDTAPLLNFSLRGNVAPLKPLIAGFVVPRGNFNRPFLIRVVGPSLSRFGVTGAWSNPEFRIFAANGSEISRGSWYYPDNPTAPSSVAAVQKLSTYVAAFPLESGSKDALGVIFLGAGSTYTIVCETGASDPGGEVLIEVYALPP